MRRICIMLCVVVSLLCVKAAHADQPVNVIGVWKGIYTYHTRQNRQIEIGVVLEIPKQFGREFAGVKTWIHPETGERLAERVSGTVGSDGKLYMVGQRNDMVVGTVKGDRMQMSFMQPGTTGTVAHYKLQRE